MYKHHKDADADEFLFMDANSFNIRGWGTAYGSSSDRIIEVVLKPENWEIHSHTIEQGYPYPWSSTFVKTN